MALTKKKLQTANEEEGTSKERKNNLQSEQNAVTATVYSQGNDYDKNPGVSETDTEQILTDEIPVESPQGPTYTPTTIDTSYTPATIDTSYTPATINTEYTPSQAVQDAMATLQNVEQNKPQDYNSRYGDALDAILQQIQNPEKFKYEFNGDELFKQYADLYTQKGRQASMDAMGQAAALTGGYGNSYAQQVGNQAYDQYLLGLYDKGMDLRDRAYQQYQDNRADLYNRLGALQGQDQTEYGRYRDAVNDWQNDRNYYAGRTDTAQNFDYNQHRDSVADQWQQQNFDYGRHRDNVGDQWNQENHNYQIHRDNVGDQQWQQNFNYQNYRDQVSDAQWQMQFDENVRQFNASLDQENMTNAQRQAATWVQAILANGQMPSAAMLQQCGLSEEDAQKLLAQMSGGSGGGGRNSGNSSGNRTYYLDNAGNIYYINEQGVPVTVPSNSLPANTPIDESRSDRPWTSAMPEQTGTSTSVVDPDDPRLNRVR